jgi:hypothetical protein
MVLGMPAYAQAPAAVDATPFALNYKWCWQHSHALLGAGTGSFMTHDQFVDGTLRAAKSGDQVYISQLWDKCQSRQASHGLINGVTAVNRLKAVRHVIACFPPTYGAGKLQEGGAATPQGQNIGIVKCMSIDDN